MVLTSFGNIFGIKTVFTDVPQDTQCEQPEPANMPVFCNAYLLWLADNVQMSSLIDK